MPLMLDELTERNSAIFDARKAGRPLRDIAHEYGLKPERIQLIYRRIAKRAAAIKKTPT
jgi:DNA-binding NarL/FixJ family response regulator